MSKNPIFIFKSGARVVTRTDKRALCKHQYVGLGDCYEGQPCHDKSFLLLSLSRVQGSFICIGADAVGSETKRIFKLLKWDPVYKPHWLRALTVRRLERAQGAFVARAAGFWVQTSTAFL